MELLKEKKERKINLRIVINYFRSPRGLTFKNKRDNDFKPMSRIDNYKISGFTRQQ